MRVYVGRSGKTPSVLGNPFTHKHGTRARHVVGSIEHAVECYRIWLRISQQ